MLDVVTVGAEFSVFAELVALVVKTVVAELAVVIVVAELAVVAVVAELVVVAVVAELVVVDYTCPVPLVTVSLERMLHSSLLFLQIICRFFLQHFVQKLTSFLFLQTIFMLFLEVPF